MRGTIHVEKTIKEDMMATSQPARAAKFDPDYDYGYVPEQRIGEHWNLPPLTDSELDARENVPRSRLSDSDD